MSNLYNISSSPHVRSKLSTGHVMLDVILALVPATAVGIYHYGLSAFLVVLTSVATAVLTELVFDKICGKGNTIKDLSAAVTGLLLALCLPPDISLNIVFIGSVFAVLIVKNFFGGLGKNFMNPALAGRCFLLISFGTKMTRYAIDGVAGATPLARMSDTAVSVTNMFMGADYGVIGSSAFALMIGGFYLLVIDAITWQIPAATLGSFALFVVLFGGRGFDVPFLLAHLCGGGIVMAAFFMATDPVTSPVSGQGQFLFGCCVGVLSGLFRLFGSSADSVSYAVIVSNLVVPLIDEFIVPRPYAYSKKETEKQQMRAMGYTKKTAPKKPFPIPMPAMVLLGVAVVAGILLSGVYTMTKDTIEEQKALANAASYKEVLPTAETFAFDDTAKGAIEALEGGVYGTGFGKAYINDALVGMDASGNVTGYVISATTAEGFDGDITISLGINADGTLSGLAFTELNETAGMGMRADEPEFKGQFSGIPAQQLSLNKAGDSTADNEIDSISGASVTSGAVINAVNAAIDFYATYFQ